MARALLMMLLCLAVAAPAYADDLVLVVDEDSPVTDLSSVQVRRLFLGETITGPDGTRLIPFNHVANTPTRVTFDRAVLKMGPSAAARYWLDRKIRGQGVPPRQLASASLINSVVTNLDGSICYLPVDAVGDDVRIVTIDGRAPGDPGYLLAEGDR